MKIRINAKKMKFFSFAALLAIVCVCAAQESVRHAGVFDGLKLPLKRHANGKIEIFLSADRAWFDADTVSAEGNISVLLLSETGATNGVIRAVRGDFNRSDMTAFCPGPVMMQKDGVCIFGENFRWNAEKQRAIIETNAVLTVARKGKSLIEN